MRIALATGIFPPDIGGPALYSRKLAEEFSAAGNKVLILTYGKKFSHTDKYRIFGVSRSWPYGLRQFMYFAGLILNRGDYDVILAFDSLGAGLPAVLAGKLLNKKVAIRMGGDFLWEKFIESGSGSVTMEEFYKKNLQKNYPVLFRLIRYALRNSSRVIFTTDFQRDIFIPHYGLEDDRVVVISNAFVKEPGIISGQDGDRKTILWAGRFIKLKNLPFLIDVFRRLSAGKRNLTLRLIGDGPEKEAVRRLAESEDLKGRVLISDSMEEGVLSEEINRAYFCVLPSLSEVSPNFALKCLGLNKPVVITQETGIKKEFPGLMYSDPKNKESFYQSMLRLLDDNSYDNYKKFILNLKTEKTWTDLSGEYLRNLSSLS